MALYLLPTANDTIGTITGLAQTVATSYTIPETLVLKMTCKKDDIEINGLFTLNYTASIAASAAAGTYTDSTTISIYQGTLATGTPIYTTTPVVRTHSYAANTTTTAVSLPQTWQVVLQYIGNPSLAITDDTAYYTITIQSTVTGFTTAPVVNLTEYTISAREIPYCNR